jgi:hypothetical protein
VQRQIKWLKKQYAVTVVCNDKYHEESVTVVTVNPGRNIITKLRAGIALLLRQFHSAYHHLVPVKELRAKIGSNQFDLYVANDIDALPFICEIAGDTPIYFDAHEYAPRHFEDRWQWRLFFQRYNIHLCKKYLPRVNLMTTVSQGLAQEYARNFGVSPYLISNAPSFQDRKPTPVHAERIRLVHHGGANPSRQLELMIRMMAHLDERFTLDLYLITPPHANKKTRAYLDLLKTEASQFPSRVHIHPPIPTDQIVETLSQYDMGVFLLPPVNFNYANTMPNKLFDFIQARLAVAIGPTPEMAKLVRDYQIGIVSEEFTPESLAARLNLLRAEEVNGFKQATNQCAKDHCAEKNEVLLMDLLSALPKKTR